MPYENSDTGRRIDVYEVEEDQCDCCGSDAGIAVCVETEPSQWTSEVFCAACARYVRKRLTRLIRRLEATP